MEGEHPEEHMHQEAHEEKTVAEGEQKQEKANPYLIPTAIVIAGALIAGALYMGEQGGGTAPTAQKAGTQQQTQDRSPENIREVTEDDHILGDIDAPIKVVEYSDFECPFCKRFHATLQQIVDESDDVAWVYRQFPLRQLHPRNAYTESLASECAAAQGGNDMFWRFADRFFELTPSNDRTDLSTVLPQIYGELGLDRAKMESCIEDGTYGDRIQEDLDNGIATGGGGTPWSIVIAPNGKKFPINGAQPYETVKRIIDLARQEQ
jgi:protein-disulfide isomerase